MNTNKEYIKNLIIRSFKGKVDQTEVQQVKKSLMNYSREDLRDLKITVKELAKVAIDEQFDKEFNVPSDWKELIRDFSHSAINVYSAVLDEEIFYQWILLEKQGGLDDKTKIIKILPTISQSIDRIVAQAPSRTANGNWKADKSLTAKFKKVMKEVQGFYMRPFFNKSLNKEDIKKKINRLVEIFENLTPEEIAIFKVKLKTFINSCLDDYAPSQIKNTPEIRRLINSAMNLLDVMYDDKLLKDFFNIVIKIAKLSLQNKQIWEPKNLLKVLQKTGTETESKNLIRNYTQHLNKLAEGGEKTNLSTEKEESIIQRLTENNSNPQLNQEDASLEDIWKNNLLVQGVESSGSLENITEKDLMRKFEKIFLDTQIKPKWYQNPWIIWPLAGTILIVGGLTVWWLTSRKKEKKIGSRFNSWN